MYLAACKKKGLLGKSQQDYFEKVQNLRLVRIVGGEECIYHGFLSDQADDLRVTEDTKLRVFFGKDSPDLASSPF